MLDFINVPIGYILSFFNKIVGNHYLLAILIFAVVVEIVLIPFGIKQQKNSIKQASLRPKEMAIRKKYAGRDDQKTRQKVQEEIQELYQKEGYNPMGGCLPLLIQFPVLILLYNVVINPLKYVCGLSADAITQASAIVQAFNPALDPKMLSTTNTINLMAQIKEVMAVDPEAFVSIPGMAELTADSFPKLTYFGINLGYSPSFTPQTPIHWWLLAVPVLTFVVYFFSSKITRKLSYQPTTENDAQMGCSNKMMDIMMPLFSVYITFITPAAIGIYWIFKSILGVLKQFILKKAMPIPTFTDEDYKAAEKEINARIDKEKTITKSGKVVRSLHHIDDEDYEDTREEALRRKAILEAQAEEEARQRAENAPKLSSLFGGASVKKDDNKKKSKKEKKAKKADEAPASADDAETKSGEPDNKDNN